VIAVVLGLRGLDPFLAVTARVPTSTLVIDGWIPTWNLAQAAAEYQRGGYERVLVVRASYGYESLDHDPGNLQILQQVLHRFGIPAERLSGVTFPGLRKDRTLTSARAVQHWFQTHGLPLDSLNLFTVGAHARRSRLLYRRAMGRDVAIGVIAAEDPSYLGARWWRYSDGIREVPFEALAYLYVRLSWASPDPESSLSL
jgi:hypothetical protein